MRRLKERVAAVTGAASGIGRALACELAAAGCHLALSDVDEVGLEDTRRQVEAKSAGRVTTERVDVADREAVFAWAAAVERDHGAAHLVFNNAGVALAARLRSVSYEDFEWLMNINFWGVVHGTRAFLPILARQDAGHIVNISSIFGIIAVPFNGVYNAAKFAVRGYTEALRMELELDELPIGVTCVHPGGIKTNIARSARGPEEDVQEKERLIQSFDKVARTTPVSCARQIIAAVRRNAPRVLVGADAKGLDVIQRLAPTGYQRLVKGVARGQWRKE
jgi:NAD(P)-dependent dehydrogenase (short-subunit alcohol dehydrogenase family)